MRAPADVLGIDCGSDAVRLVRVKKNGNSFCLAGGAVLASVDTESESVNPLSLPVKLRGRFAALTAPSRPESVKILRLLESFDPDSKAEILARMNCKDDEDVRLAVRVLIPGAHKLEARLLAAVMPERQAEGLLALMPTSGAPAARSLGIAELGVINAFYRDPRFIDSKQARGLIHFDHDYSLIALFNDNQLSQFRTFSFGVHAVLQKICKALNLDSGTAGDVLNDGAFDISHLIEEDFRDVRSQLVISRDFMERSENCTLEELHISGPASLTRPFIGGLPVPESISNWSVLEPYAEAAAGDIPEELAAEPWRLAAAVGAALGVLSPS